MSSEYRGFRLFSITIPTQGSGVKRNNNYNYEFKHNNSNRPFAILIQRVDWQPFCPLHTLIQYCKVRGSGNGPLCCFPDASPVTVSQFNTELRRCLIFCGLDSAHYKSHSFRFGAASDAAEMGFTDTQIKTFGRWKSDAFKL